MPLLVYASHYNVSIQFEFNFHNHKKIVKKINGLVLKEKSVPTFFKKLDLDNSYFNF